MNDPGKVEFTAPKAPARIAKRLRTVWVSQHDPPAERILSWKDKHPEWDFEVIRNHDGWANQHVIDAIIARERNWGAPVCDVIRWELLAGTRDGVVVVDADSMCLRALDSEQDGFKTDFLLGDWCHYENEQAFPGRVACNAMGAAPKSMVYSLCVEEVSKVDVAKVPQGKIRDVVGAGLLNRILKGPLRDKIIIYPSKMFVPVHYTGAKAPETPGVKMPSYSEQGHGFVKGYNHLRPWPCQCEQCRKESHGMFPPWA